MMIHYTVYKITNKVNGKIYIGVHQTTDLDDGYYGSGKLIQRAINKHGIDQFEKEILHVFDNPEDMFAKESELVNEDFINRKDTYNINVGGHGGWDYVNAEGLNAGFVSDLSTNTQKIRSVKANLIRSEKIKFDSAFRKEYCKNISLGLKRRFETQHGNFLGKNHSEESKKKMSKAHAGKHEGKKNSQFGTCWIFNETEKRSIKIPKENLNVWISKGWIKGRKIKF